MKTKIPKPKYKAGAEVFCTAKSQNLQIVGVPQWNGYTYMYSFLNTDFRCGELYLKIKE